MITAALNVVVAQRLARKVCKDCKEPVEISPAALEEIQVPKDKIGSFTPYKGKGCATCSDTGYKGRVACYEVLQANDEMKDLILNGASTAELKAEAIRLGMKTLRMSALNKFMEGVTTLEEVTRVSAAD